MMKGKYASSGNVHFEVQPIISRSMNYIDSGLEVKLYNHVDA